MVCVAEGCAQDLECGGDERCVDGGCVEFGAARCGDDGDCGHRWRCSALGTCFEGQCLAHADCEASQWCREGICVERAGTTGALRLARTYPPQVSNHASSEQGSYGTGGALLNYDGDRDLDLFLGGWDPERDSPPCLYRNVTRPREVLFEAVEALCSFDVGPIVTAGGVDVEGDGTDELILMGPGTLRLERFEPTRQSTDLMALLDEDDPRRDCTIGAYAATDLDLDGHVDLLFGCQERKRPDDSTQNNLAFYQRGEGAFVPEALPGYGLLDNPGQTLALGVIDLNDDGLLDIVVVNDAFVNGNNFRDSGLDSGVTLLRNAPDAAEAFTALPLGREERASGSFMGVGNIDVDGQGEHLYLTDYGPNRLIQYVDQSPIDIARELDVELGLAPRGSVFSWAAIVEDLDRNGLDDLFISQGMASSNDAVRYEEHVDTILLQTRQGHFEALTTEAGLDPPSYEDTQGSALPYSSRGAAKMDLDRNGYMDLIVGGLDGVFRFYEEQPTEDNAADRCTLIPRNTVVPGYGLGYAVAQTSEGPWRRRDMQGQSRMGLSPWVLSSVGRGLLRFPSGAQVPFDCDGRPGPVVVEEPQWVQVERAEAPRRVRVSFVEAPWLQDQVDLRLTLAIRDQDGAVQLVEATEAQGGWEAPLGERDAAIMVRLGARWVARWFPL